MKFYRTWNAGMMGSGKTTVGKILSQVLGYSFFDRFVTIQLHEVLLSLYGGRARVCLFCISPNEALACLHLRQWLSVCVSCSDKLVEEAVGATSVAQIFEDYSESFFRDNEVWQCVGVDCSLVVIQREIKSLCTL